MCQTQKERNESQIESFDLTFVVLGSDLKRFIVENPKLSLSCMVM